MPGLGNAPGNIKIFTKGIAELRAQLRYDNSCSSCQMTMLGDVHRYIAYATRDREHRKVSQLKNETRFKFSDEADGRHMASARRYEKGRRLNQQLHSVPLEVLQLSTQANKSKESSKPGVESFKKSHRSGLPKDFLRLC